MAFDDFRSDDPFGTEPLSNAAVAERKRLAPYMCEHCPRPKSCYSQNDCMGFTHEPVRTFGGGLGACSLPKHPTSPSVVAATPRLPTESEKRKGVPLATGVLDYFPDALAEVARLSKIGNDKHNPGQPMHWSRGKSDDHADCIIRHMMERGTIDTDGVLHDAKVAWRALAQLQLALEKQRSLKPEHAS